MDDLLTARQVQEILNIDRTTVYRMLKDGRLNGIKIGQHWRFPKEQILSMINRKSYFAGQNEDISLGTFPIHCLQGLQDVFAEIAGLGSITIDQHAKEVTNFSNSCAFCKCIQSSSAGLAACRSSWRKISKVKERKEHFFVCHAGLFYTKAQMRTANGFDSFLIVGQFFPNQQKKEQAALNVEDLSKDLKIDRRVLYKEFKSIPVLSEKTSMFLNNWMEKVAQILVGLMSERYRLIKRLQKISEISAIE